MDEQNQFGCSISLLQCAAVRHKASFFFFLLILLTRTKTSWYRLEQTPSRMLTQPGSQATSREEEKVERKKKTNRTAGSSYHCPRFGGTWTSETAQQQLFFKQLPRQMPFFFGLFWQTLPSWVGACQAQLLCLLVSKWEAKARAGSFPELLRESNLCELMS